MYGQNTVFFHGKAGGTYSNHNTLENCLSVVFTSHASSYLKHGKMCASGILPELHISVLNRVRLFVYFWASY
jgi:hypothetical protein